MNNLYFKLYFLLFVLLISCSEEKLDGESYGTVTGKVVMADSFTPIENVKILSSPATSTVFTDAEGKFKISNIKVGEYSFQAQKDDYVAKFEAVTVTVNSTSEIVFELSKATTNNKPPTVPIPATPTDNATGQLTSLDLTWTCTDPDKDELSYTVTLRNNSNDEVKIYDAVKDKKLTISDLLFGVKYYWQVSANDGINVTVLSAISTFSTIAFPETRYLFVKKNNNNNVIFVADDAGKQYQLTGLDKNCWRPRKNNQAKKIAFIGTNGSQNDIYTMNFDGTEIKRITSSVPIAGFNSDYVGYSWNSSGNQLIYPNFDKLYKINNDGSGLIKIFQTPNGKFISECEWSVDGSKIALKVNNASGYSVEIYIIDASGNLISNVLSGQNGAVGGLNFSVTGQKLLYTRDISGFENASYRQLDTRIYEYSLASGFSTQLETEKVPGTNDLDARYSPNESEVIFTNTSNDGISVKNIMKTNSAVLNSRVILFSGAFMPDWE